MSGKAVSRALQGHFLIELALTTKLFRNFFPDDQVKDSSDKEHLEIEDNEEELDECVDENNEIIMEWSKESVVFTSFEMKKINELCEIIKEESEKSTNHALESHDLRIVDENLKILKETPNFGFNTFITFRELNYL